MWKIKPLHVATIERDLSNFLYMRRPGTKVEVPIIAWYVFNDERHIMVDTGCSDLDKTLPFHLPMKQEIPFRELLEREGIEPEKIDTIIQTHLHWDHCYNNRLFPNAEVIVQRRELEYSVAPFPIHYTAYESPQLGLIPPYMGSRIRTVDGDRRLMDGIEVIFTPGHSPGSQSVIVDTAAGRFILVGDTVPTYANWRGDDKWPHIPDGAHLDLSEYWQSFERLEQCDGTLLPSHEWAVLGKIYG